MTDDLRAHGPWDESEVAWDGTERLDLGSLLIAATPGVDVLFLGPGDMSLRLNCSASVNDPDMMEAQRKIAAAAKKHGKAWGRPVGTQQDAKTIVDMGAQLVVLGGAFLAIYDHLAQCGGQLDEILGASPAGSGALTGKTY